LPTTIPYDPRLTLGNIVPPERIVALEAEGKLLAEIDAAQDAMEAQLTLKRSLKMTIQELSNLGVDPASVMKQMEEVDKAITTAADNYASVSVKNHSQIAANKNKGGDTNKVSFEIESPLNYNRSRLKQIPLAADSITMDAQYFSYDENRQSSSDTMASIKSFVSASTSFMGTKRSAEISDSAQSQVSAQRESHDVEGTLIITANVTHKAASLWAPFYIDVDKGIRAWNEMYPKDRIDMTDSKSMIEIEKADAGDKAPPSYNILSGATFGSSFIGMVHVLKQSDTSSSQRMLSTAASLQATMSTGSWFAKMSGGFGVNASFSNSVKNLLSSASISSHVSLLCMGIIPTIEANNVSMAVKGFTEFSPDKTMGQLAAMQNATASEQDSVKSAAESARTQGTLVQMQSSQLKAAVSAVGEIDSESNKMLDINSLMTAFTDFVNKAIAGECGVPINYYLKPITKKQLAQMWIAKYIPGEYVTSAGDDTGNTDDST